MSNAQPDFTPEQHALLDALEAEYKQKINTPKGEYPQGFMAGFYAAYLFTVQTFLTQNAEQSKVSVSGEQ